MPPRLRAGIYCRISQDREGAGLGVDRQRADCERLAAKLGWQVIDVYIDPDDSAYSGKPRKDYRRLLVDLEAGRLDAVVVWHTDRLHRSPRELEEYVGICERRGITTQTVKAGELDLATPSGRAVARTLGAWARFEVEHKSDRTRRAQLQAAQAGRWLGGAPPLGWRLRKDGSAVLDRPAAARIRKASTDVLAGVSLGAVVRTWNDTGFLSSRGNPWNYATLRQVLTRARNAGLIEYNGDIVGTSTWPALVTEDTWRALCALLADPGRRVSSSNRVRWLMAGLARCGAEGCRQPLRSSSVQDRRGGHRTVYKCRATGPGHVARSAPAVDQLVLAVIGERLARPDAVGLLRPAVLGIDPAGLQAEAMALRGRLDEAADSFADGVITQTQLAKITARVRARLADVEAEMAAGRRASAVDPLLTATDPRAAWLAAPIDRQRAVIRELVDVTVLPGRRGKVFDPELIAIEWQAGEVPG
jgi:site-specific DNA recombinase